MGRKSAIDTQLSPEDKTELNRKIATGCMTIDQMTEWLHALGYVIARSSVGLHKKKVDRVAEKLRQSREISDSLSKQLGDSLGDGEQTRLLTEITRSLVFDFQMKAMEHGTEFEPGDFFFLAKAQKELAQTMRLSQDFEIRIERVRAEEQKKAITAVEKVAKKQGLSPEARQAFEEALGYKRNG